VLLNPSRWIKNGKIARPPNISSRLELGSGPNVRGAGAEGGLNLRFLQKVAYYGQSTY